MTILSPAQLTAQSFRHAKRTAELCEFNVLAAHLQLHGSKTSAESHSAHQLIREAEERHKHAINKLRFELR